MEIIKKYGIKALCLLAFVALFLPMAKVTVEGSYGYSQSISVNGFQIAFRGYICILLILGPAAIIAADYVAVMKKFQALIQVGVAALGIILSFVGYAQSSKIAAAGQAAGMGYADVQASLGFGAILCIIAYIGILGMTIFFQKDAIKNNIDTLKNLKK